MVVSLKNPFKSEIKNLVSDTTSQRNRNTNLLKFIDFQINYFALIHFL
jgi:hypothetical protein